MTRRKRYAVAFTPVGWQVIDREAERADIPVAEYGQGSAEYARAKARAAELEAINDRGDDMTDTYETIRQALIAHSGTPNLDAFHEEASAICEALARADEPVTPAAPERGSSRAHDPEAMR